MNNLDEQYENARTRLNQIYYIITENVFPNNTTESFWIKKYGTPIKLIKDSEKVYIEVVK